MCLFSVQNSLTLSVLHSSKFARSIAATKVEGILANTSLTKVCTYILGL